MSLPTDRAARVLIVAEGPSEIGELDQLAGALPAAARGRARRPEGYIPPMLRGLLRDLPRPITIEAQRVTSIGRYDKKPRLKGHADRAAKALALASSGDYDLLVFVKDVDRAPGRKKSDVERRKKLAEMHQEIEAGFADVTGANDVARVKATPCRMIEAWALGDPRAIAVVRAEDRLASKAPPASPIPARPETLWGDESDPDSDHPKCVLRRALGQDASARVFEQLATLADAAALERSCVESFAPFVAELRRIVGATSDSGGH